MENILYLGGPNIASEIHNKEYANARICGADKWRKPLAKFLRQPHFIVWDNGDLVTHEIMGGLKNVYAIGAGNFSIVFLHGYILYSTASQKLVGNDNNIHSGFIEEIEHQENILSVLDLCL